MDGRKHGYPFRIPPRNTLGLAIRVGSDAVEFAR